jgi:hypothetical protein
MFGFSARGHFDKNFLDTYLDYVFKLKLQFMNDFSITISEFFVFLLNLLNIAFILIEFFQELFDYTFKRLYSSIT